ncbi:MAG: translation initiation factor IF-3 [Desulfomonilia bacterium]|nr:translation initiation factor IF-3 [Deltaproteobacteria bacterium]MDX9761437.1 translation initiation factor IF-3 [Desulfomonilia bacterium]HPW68806.1 translation initiation factor IF-3 [Deltaproteobacteria bacterium]
MGKGKDTIRVNDQISSESVRVISPEGEQMGIMTVPVAIERARDYGMDLVEVAPTANPPVCRIMEYGKYKYEKSKREHAARKKQTVVVIKEIKFRPKTDEHDYQFKLKHIERFLKAKNKVKVVIRFRGREIIHMDKGMQILKRVCSDLEELAAVESGPKNEGRTMVMMLAPKT